MLVGLLIVPQSIPDQSVMLDTQKCNYDLSVMHRVV